MIDMKMNFDFYVISDKGEFRKSNQDCAYAKTFQNGEDTTFFGIVCDGMGGLSHGEVASNNVVSGFTKWFEKDYPLIAHNETFENTVSMQWQSIINDSNEELRVISAQNSESMESGHPFLWIRIQEWLKPRPSADVTGWSCTPNHMQKDMQ